MEGSTFPPGKVQIQHQRRAIHSPSSNHRLEATGTLKVREHQCGRQAALSSAGTLGSHSSPGHPPGGWGPASCHPRGTSEVGGTGGLPPLLGAWSARRLSQISLWFLGTPQTPKASPLPLLPPSARFHGLAAAEVALAPSAQCTPRTQCKEVPPAPLTLVQGRTAPSFSLPSLPSALASDLPS